MVTTVSLPSFALCWALIGIATAVLRPIPQRVANRELLCDELTKQFAEQPRNYWLELLDKAGIPCGAIHNIAEALAMPQALARGWWLILVSKAVLFAH